MLVDSHCHLTDALFDEDRSEVLRRAGEAGVGKILTIASDREDAERVVRLLDEEAPGVVGSPDERAEGKVAHLDAETGPMPDADGKSTSAALPALWGTAGIHPHDAAGAREGDLDVIRGLARSHPRIVAVGETGLDFYYDNSPRASQEALFRDHLALAEELDLPIVVHSRNADELTRRLVKEWGHRVRGVLHCFTGGRALLDTALALGWMVSFTGIVTFKKYDGQALVRSVPRGRLMVETDAPYLAPVPHRGRRNEPAYVGRVAACLAGIRGEDLEDVRGYTSENAVRFFGLNP
jgi:TatD DNase family protein